MYSQELIALAGLTKEDLQILRCLKSESLSTAQIKKRTSLPRSTVVYRLEILVKKGFISEDTVGKRILYQSIGQNELVQKITRADIVSKNSKGSCTTYRGIEGIISLWHTMTSLPQNTRFTVIQPHRSFRTALKKTPAKIAIAVSEKIKRKGFIIDAIEQEKAAQVIATVYGKGSKETRGLANAFMGRLEDIVKVPDDFLDETAEVFIFKNHVVFIDWNDEVAFDIYDPHIHKLVLAMFEKVKAHGSRYQLGKYVDELVRRAEAVPRASL